MSLDWWMEPTYVSMPLISMRRTVNRKGYHSINVQMVCDAGFRIQNVVDKWPGSVHDARIFRQSSLCHDLENGVMDGYLLGDSGYACCRYLLTPYLNTRLPAQERYNRALVKTRVIIEQTYGVLKRRFPCLSYDLRTATKMLPDKIDLLLPPQLWSQ